MSGKRLAPSLASSIVLHLDGKSRCMLQLSFRPSVACALNLFCSETSFRIRYACLASPFAFCKRLTGLGSVAMIAFAIVLWTAMLVTLSYFRIDAVFEPCEFPKDTLPCNNGSFDALPPDSPELLKRLGLFSLAFVCQPAVLMICNEVRDTRPDRSDAMIVFAHTVGGCVVTVVSLFAYATYGSVLEADMLKSFPRTRIFDISRSLFAVVVVIAYLIQLHPCRQAVFALVQGDARLSSGSAESDTRLFYGVTVGLLAGTTAVGLSVSRLGPVYNFVGATTSTAICYIFPCILYMRAFPSAHRKRSLCKVMQVMGWLLMLMSVAAQFQFPEDRHMGRSPDLPVLRH
eukprot:TRINITY_DN54590_c0_g1_i1.p1 TRINITY_DN54590_c0_g1~~TRINITY_DN54590_c0_g1_i1.p1  ORF type:complete len:345 (+),score=28.06 TRINITY_DN54590_c0_g1_i1:337-1371(+)